MIRILLILFSLSFFNANSQEKEVILLTEILATQKVKTFFYLENNSVIINDRTGILFEHKNDFINAEISYAEKYNEISPNKYVLNIEKQLLILYKYEKKRNKVYLYLWQPYSGGTLTVVAKFKKNNKIKKIDFFQGAF